MLSLYFLFLAEEACGLTGWKMAQAMGVLVMKVLGKADTGFGLQTEPGKASLEEKN